MKNSVKFVLFITAIGVLYSCTPAEENHDLIEMKSRRDQLKQEIDGLTTQLLAIEDSIAQLSDDYSLLQVTTYEARPSSFDHYFTVQGNIETDRNALVFPESQGIVSSVRVAEGQRVEKGQVLLTLDTELIRNNIAEVETQYALAQEIYERQKRLWEQNIGSEVQFLEAKTNKERLENTLETLNSQLSMGSVKAPFGGIVDQITPKIGEMASPAMPVARVISLDQMYVTADVSEFYVGSVDQGMRVQVILPGADTISTQLERVGKFIKPDNRTFEVSAPLEKHPALRPNMYCALLINDAHYDSTMVVPSSMIQQDVDGRSFLYVLKAYGEAYKVQKQIVTTAESFDGRIRIANGLSAGDLIVEKGARRVVDGQDVEIYAEQSKEANN